MQGEDLVTSQTGALGQHACQLLHTEHAVQGQGSPPLRGRRRGGWILELDSCQTIGKWGDTSQVVGRGMQLRRPIAGVALPRVRP